MPDFEFLENPISKKWVILAPRRADRPDVAKGTEPECPFCLGRGENWLVHVVPNKYPFAPIHEVIIHSPDHHKNFGELPLSQVELIFKTYKERYNKYKDKGQVYIFHNRGEAAGESLPHPHTQLAVVPKGVALDMPPLGSVLPSKSEIRSTKSETNSQASPDQNSDDQNVSNFEFRYSSFSIFCPLTSQWPDEVWVAPKKRGRAFGDITDEEIVDLSYILTRIVEIFNLRHGSEFAFNFYIYPGRDWYLCLFPRSKVLGGFEIGTGIFINTQDSKETIGFIKEHF